MPSDVIGWLLEGDVSVQYQTKRDLLGAAAPELAPLRRRIATEGWGLEFLKRRDNATGMWGGGLYSPKWTSTHYTLLDLHFIGLDPATREYRESAALLLDGLWYDGGQRRKGVYQDVCVTGMLLIIACPAPVSTGKIHEIIDYLLERQYPDGGWNCRWQRGDTHSSLHTTLNVLEGLHEYSQNGYTYRIADIRAAVPRAHAFILQHRLYQSHRTGETIEPRMLALPHPRWRFDILRCLDYFQSAGVPYDPGMEDALTVLERKRNTNGSWPLQARIPGEVHFDMEQAGKPGRWNTLRALRVFKKYAPERCTPDTE